MTREEAIKAIKAWDFLNNDEKEVIETLIPELKESEDERIRKEIISALKNANYKGVYDKHLAWLEKQGKETSWKPSKEEMDVLYGLAYITNQYDEHKEEVITRLYQDLKREFFNGSSYENMFPTNTSTEDDVRRRNTIQVLEYARSLDAYNQYGKADIDKNIAWLERQGEQGKQKSADKVEPKFKVGDWIIDVQGVSVDQIMGIEYDDYLIKTSCSQFYLPIKLTEKNYWLWTIEDTKDGDVLVASDKSLFIYDGSINENGSVGFHIALTEDMDIILNSDDGCGWEEKDSCHLATKKQRDLLFSKMKEEGYEWDDEKLELIKVPKLKEPEGALKHLLDEQEKLYKEAEIILENKDTALAFLKRTGIIDENGELSEKYRSEQTLATTISVGNGINSTAITDGNTSVTSEEVERQYCTEQYEPDVRDFPIEWSEEDERNLQGVIDEIEANKSNAPDYDAATYDRFLSWLKSLKERYTWKPSDEQIELLEALVEDNNQRYFYTTLNSLYEQLKKLREG